MRATTRMWTAGLMAALAWQLAAALPAAAVDADVKCEAGKLKEAAKYVSCRLKADSKALTTAVSPDYSKCDGKFTTKFPQLEEKAGLGVCPTEGDQPTEQVALTADAVATAWRLSAEPRFIDNGDGTITDRKTNLMWEKKIKLDGTENLLDARDADNAYLWAGYCSGNTSKRCQPNADASGRCFDQVEGNTSGCDLCGVGEGTCDTFGEFTIWTFIDVVNDVELFAGYNDWRVPTIREFESLRSDDLTKYDPAVDLGMHGTACGTACANVASPECSCTASSGYWSATTGANYPTHAWNVFFGYGFVDFNFKYYGYHVRAVRGGL